MRTVKLTKESTKDILENLLKRSQNNYGKFESTVAQIIDKVKNEGDAALFAASQMQKLKRLMRRLILHFLE